MRRGLHHNLLLITLLAASAQSIAAQSDDGQDHRMLVQEQIYLQTDKPYYATGDTVWLRAHLLDALTNRPVSPSRFVYVELHDQEADTLCQRLMLKADGDGVFANALLLPKTMKSGVYTMAAYTQWMRNFGPERFCYQPLTVVGGQHVRGHCIPLHLLAEHGAEVRIIGEAATANRPMTLDISMQDRNGQPLSGIFALSVTDYDVVKPDSLFGDIRQSMLRQQLTHSTDKPCTVTYPYQERQLITGSVKGTLGQRLKNPHLIVVNNRTGLRDEFELGDSTRFALAVDIPNGTIFTLEGTRRSGRTSLVELKIDSVTFPKLKLPHYQLTEEAADFAAFTTQSRKQQMFNRADYIELPEVEKVGKKPQVQKANFLNIEAPRGIMDGDPWLERAPQLRVILHRFGIFPFTDATGREHINSVASPQYVGKIYVDNMQYSIADGEDGDVLNIPPQNIKSIEYFPTNHAENTIFGVRPLTDGTIPGILFIFLKDGSEIFREKASQSLSMATVRQLGYEQPVEFYSPQYPDPSQKTRPDLRTTLYWNPKVRTDTRGHATVSFYASDVSKRYLVTLEGISDDGTIIHQQQIIE